MTIQYNNPVGADYQGIDGIEKVTCSHSTGRLHFFPTGETRSPATPSHASPSFPLLKKYSHHQGSNHIRIDRQYAANMPPIAVSVAVVDRQKPLIPGLKSPGLKAFAHFNQPSILLV